MIVLMLTAEFSFVIVLFQKEINDVLSQYNINAQMLLTRGEIGYLMADINKEISHECDVKMRAMQHTIRSRFCS